VNTISLSKGSNALNLQSGSQSGSLNLKEVIQN
jgi:hypothetical protein